VFNKILHANGGSRSRLEGLALATHLLVGYLVRTIVDLASEMGAARDRSNRPLDTQ
jgi:hypothetical protein